jgi:hypothetical protein
MNITPSSGSIIHKILINVCSAIPEGYNISLELTSSQMVVKLRKPDGDIVYFNHDYRFDDLIKDALKYALDEVEQFRRNAEIMESVNDRP